MPKGYEYGKKIEYRIEPKPIKIDYNGRGHCCCDNCATVDKVFKIHYNETDFANEVGAILKKRTAKPRQLWLCEDCFKELIDAIQPALLQALNCDVKIVEKQLREIESESVGNA